MKAQYSEQYYRNNWERFIKKSNDKDYMNLEYALDYKLKIFESDVAEKLRVIYANEIYTSAIKHLKDTMITIQDIQSGKTSLGYTTKSQEISEMRRMIQRFEFNCLQARDFKEKYSIKA